MTRGEGSGRVGALRGRLGLMVGGGLAVGAGLLAAAGVGFPDAPPARVTGGFGEDSCFACHWDGVENDGVGRLAVTGFPEAYRPGTEYEVSVKLSHPDLVSGGFQLAVRAAADGRQAGDLRPASGDATRVGILVDREVHFAHHTASGVDPSGEGATGWTLRWIAPEEAMGPLALHVSAVSGDGDFSQMGDAVYTLGLESRPDGAP